VHGGAGVSDDTPLASFWAHARTLRIVDGPDAVHIRGVAKEELERQRPYSA
jgi:acyl-CoA dehydrogenase